MVRLKEFLRIFLDFCFLFQFHYGTIKSIWALPLKGSGFRFNSTMVRLKEGKLTMEQVNTQSFNSTMVRLKVTDELDTDPLRCRFNSTMVRLKVS